MDDAAKMYELQKIDLTWTKVRRRLMEIQKQLGESEELKRAREQAAKTEAELHAWHAKQQDAELESKTLAGRIQSAEDQLMSGSIHIPKELEALQASADALKRQRAQVEDEAVTAMLAVDELKAQLDEQRSALAKLEADWSSDQEGLRSDEAKMKHNYVLIKRRRDGMAESMSPALLEQYEQMRQRRGGVAVAPVQNGECGVCHVRLPTGVISALQGNREGMVLCTSCGRYLFLA